MAQNSNEIEKRLWDAADELRANSKLKASEYSVPVLGLIFLRYADHKFSQAEKGLEGKGTGRKKLAQYSLTLRPPRLKAPRKLPRKLPRKSGF